MGKFLQGILPDWENADIPILKVHKLLGICLMLIGMAFISIRYSDALSIIAYKILGVLVVGFGSHIFYTANHYYKKILTDTKD